VPCAFAFPRADVVVCEPYPVAVAYTHRGAGSLWQTQSRTSAPPTAKLLGTSRAEILALLDSPISTTELAERAKLSLPAVSQHLAVLRANGLVESRPAGRTRLSRRTALGDPLLDAAT